MKKVLMLMLGLVAGTASFANFSVPQPLPIENRLVMTPGRTIKFYVQALQTNGTVMIQDADGRVVYRSAVNLQKGLKQQFDLSGLSVGTYHLTLTTGADTLTKTFVMQARPNESFVMQES